MKFISRSNFLITLNRSEDLDWRQFKISGRTSWKPERPVLSGFLNEVRTYFEQKFCLHAENSHTKR